MIYDERVTRGVAHMKACAVSTMTDMVERMAKYDVDLATRAARYLVVFMRQMPWAHRKDAPYENELVAEQLPEGTDIFGHFLVVSSKDHWRPTEGYAAWFPESSNLILYSTFDARQVLAGGVLFHELFHAHDLRMMEPANHVPFADGTFPAESDAWNFQSRVLDAVVGGRYFEEIKRLADREVAGTLRAFRHEGLVLPAMNPKFLREFSPKMPDNDCINALMAQVQYDLAYELIERRYAEDEVKRRRALLYTQFQKALQAQRHSPALIAFARDFASRW